jgi:hypothetical protein
MGYGGREAAASCDRINTLDQSRPDPTGLLLVSGGRRRVLSLFATVFFTLPTGYYFSKYEGGPANMFFIWSVTLTPYIRDEEILDSIKTHVLKRVARIGRFRRFTRRVRCERHRRFCRSN